ncbi:MAG: 30S ribosome-binding factor RbfA [Alphaproteobacteria bacterium]|nr:30S ribosome-binding factor RbfA [Alphaproteobacteria bacterium]
MAKEISQRQLRVGEEVKRIIAEEINFNRVRNLEGVDTLVTIIDCSVSPDLKYADIFFVTSNDSLNQVVQEALQLAANHFRKVVARKTALRYVPEIRFSADPSMSEADKIERLLNDPKVKKDLVSKNEA